MVDLAGMSVDRRHEAARQVMVRDGLSLKQAYEKLVDGSTVENRLLSGEERAIWSTALSDATELALSISPFLSLLRPVYTTSIAGLAVDDGYRLMVGPWFFDPDAGSIRPTLLLHEVLHPFLGHKSKQLAVETALMAGDCQINQCLRWNPWLDWPRRADWTVEALFPEDVRTPGYPKGLPEKKDYGCPRRADRREWEDDPSMIRRGWVDPEVSVAVVLDVSGSMDSCMGDALSELQAALRACDGARVTVVAADDGVTGVKTVEDVRELGKIRHGGGTMLAPAVGWLASSLDPKPSMVIIITDGGLGDWGDMEKEIRHGALAKRAEFLVVLTGSWGARQMPASLRSATNVETWVIDPAGSDGSVRPASALGRPDPGSIIDEALSAGD